MKFISGILDKSKENGQFVIEIPRYHRAAISFLDGNYAYYVVRAPAPVTKEGGQIQERARELILTPIRPDKWHLTRRVTITCKDRTGIIQEISNALVLRGVNILVQEAATTQGGDTFSITLFVNLETFRPINATTDSSSIGALVTDQLGKVLEDDLATEEKALGMTERPRVNKLAFLHSISWENRNSPNTGISTAQFNRFNEQITPANRDETLLQIVNGKIALKAPLVSELQLKNTTKVHYTIDSDTEEKYFKILFFREDQTVAFIDVHHIDRIGAIEAFTKTLRSNPFNYNILSCYSHVRVGTGTAHWFALIELDKDKDNVDKFFQPDGALCKLDEYRKKIEGRGPFLRHLFLVETNADIGNINYADAIVRYGQSRKTHDNLETGVFKKKKEYLQQKLERFGLPEYKEETRRIEEAKKNTSAASIAPHKFYAKNESFAGDGTTVPLYCTDTERRLVEKMVNELSPLNQFKKKLLDQWPKLQRHIRRLLIFGFLLLLAGAVAGILFNIELLTIDGMLKKILSWLVIALLAFTSLILEHWYHNTQKKFEYSRSK